MARYRFGEKIGSGGFGEVVAAVRLDDGHPCAVKRLKKNTSENDRARFEREVRIQGKLRHRNVVKLLGSNLAADKPRPWFAMPRALYSLRDMVKTKNGLSQLPVFYQIAAGVEYAHENGVLHRDLKPENVLFFEDDEHQTYAAVGDFGLGRFISRDSPTLTQSNIRMGTVEYMAPEQYTDAKNAGKGADIWALGKLLFEILTGEMAFPTIKYSELEPRFQYIVRKCCKDDPSERYESVADLVADLDTMTEKRSLLTQPATALRKELGEALADALDGDRIDSIARLLIENVEDNEILSVLLPRLPLPVLDALFPGEEDRMIPVMQAYDAEISGGLPFEYCDVAATFYERVFQRAGSADLRRMILRRLPRLALAHNRWYVGEVYARLVAGLSDEAPSDEALLFEVASDLRGNPELAEWNANWLRKLSIAPLVRDALRGE